MNSRPGVPAVRNALALLDVLRAGGNEPRTMSELARATGMNSSTCFNILKTLEQGGVIAHDSAAKTYRLGLRLVDYASVVGDEGEARRLIMEEARRVTEVVGLGCFLMTYDATHDEFVVLDKAESTHPIRVTIDIGARFPATGAVAAKAWFAWRSPDELDAVVDRYGLPAFTPRSVTDSRRFAAELESVRGRGYATSVAEYYPDHNAVAATVFGRDGDPWFLLVVVGTASQLSRRRLAVVGEELATAADRATKVTGGKRP